MFDNLFDAEPNIREFFSEIAGPPKAMMWATLGLVVDNLEELDTLAMPLSQLGARHEKFGARSDSYASFADVVIGTVATINGEDWTDAHEDAWEKMMGHVVDRMLEGAEGAKASAA